MSFSLKNITRFVLKFLGVYSCLQKTYQRIGEAKIERRILHERAKSLWYPEIKYVEAGNNLYKIATGKVTPKALEIPINIKSLRIDVGLSYTAPNTALWIKNDPSVYVFGFEPNQEALAYLLYGKIGRCNQRKPIASSLRKVGGLNVEKYLGKNLSIFDIAIDDSTPSMKQFNMTDEVGTSSFHQPLKYNVRKKTEVASIRLFDFMALIPWNRFDHVDLIKVDTQGNDLSVLKSAGEYLKKIVYVVAEIPLKDEYIGAHSESDLDGLMKNNDFETIVGTDNDKVYGNRKFRHLWSKIDYKTIEM